MTKLIRLLLFLLWLPVLSFAQEYEQVTSLGYNRDLGTTIHEIDDFGNAYVSMLHSNHETSSILFPNGNADGNMVFSKLSPQGTVIWNKPLIATIYYVKTDLQQNVYISGVGGNIKLQNGSTLPGGSFVIKLDKDGNTLWGVVKERDYNTSSATSGPIALASDGIYWNSSFYGTVEVQGRMLQAKVPGSPDSFVTKINSSGQVTALYHDNSSSIIQEMVEAENGNAAFLISRGGIPKFKVIIDENCRVLSEEPFILYGDFPAKVNKTTDGYEMLTRIGLYTSAGYVERGFYHVSFDRNMDLIDSVKVFEPYQPMNADAGGRFVIDAVGSKANGFYIESPPQPYSITYHKDWLHLDDAYNISLIEDENQNITIGDDPYSRYYVKMTGDTLHLLIRHFTYYHGNTFTLNNQTYTTPSVDNFSWFWAKYIFRDPDSCKKIKAQVVKQGIEGSQNAVIKFNLPESCPATEPVVISLLMVNPEKNNGDFSLPSTVTINPGASAAELIIPVLDDNMMELKENFKLAVTIAQNNAGYRLNSTELQFNITDDDAEDEVDISFPAEVPEGSSGPVTLSIPNGKVSPVDLSFSLNLSNSSFRADKELDYTFPELILPAGTNSIEIQMNALDDDLIEGDEFVTGLLSANPNTFRTFKARPEPVQVKILDVDNTYENRVFYISPNIDSLKEGTTQRYNMSLKPPLLLQRPISISAIATAGLPSYVTQSTREMQYQSTATGFSMNHFDNWVINKDGPILLNLISRDLQTGDYRFYWRDEFTDAMEIHLVDNDKPFSGLNAPSAFSPNGDGINDTWIIKSLNYDPNCHVTVVNRYGTVIFDSTGYTLPWDGKLNGDDAPVGTYFYQISTQNERFSGSVMLIK